MEVHVDADLPIAFSRGKIYSAGPTLLSIVAYLLPPLLGANQNSYVIANPPYALKSGAGSK